MITLNESYSLLTLHDYCYKILIIAVAWGVQSQYQYEYEYNCTQWQWCELWNNYEMPNEATQTE